jgi:Domain of unknown function (DUF6268)
MKHINFFKSLSALCALLFCAQADDLDFGVAKAVYTYNSDVNLDSGGELKFDKLLLQSALSKPIYLNDQLFFVPASRYEFSNVESPFFSGDLHSFELPLSLILKDKSSPWTYSAKLSPGITSDFEQVTSDDFFLDGRISAAYKFTENFSLNFGVAYTRFNGEPQFLPSIGFSWSPCEDVNLSLYGPRFQVRYKLNENWIVRFQTEPGGGVWNIDQGSASRDFSITSYRAGFAVERKIHDQLWLTAGAGFTLFNEVETLTNSGDTISKTDGDEGAYVNLGVRLAEF